MKDKVSASGMKKQILLGHGSGGKLSHELISGTILPYFKNAELDKLGDAAVFKLGDNRVAFSTDSYVVDPIIFPGGDIGKLAVCGTVNDLSMMGAKPLYMSAGIIMEEGLPVDTLEQILDSMRKMAEESGVQIITGDTKVVPHGAVDKIFINTAGIGIVPQGIDINGDQAKPGDVVIINGSIADHGITIMASREGLEMDIDLKTDSAPLNNLVDDILRSTQNIHVMRDPTRGGVATTLNEIAGQSNVAIKLYEKNLPISEKVQSVCEILGLDPLYIANEGKCLVICPESESANVLMAMKNNKYGRDAKVIGEVLAEPRQKVFLETLIGGQRIIDMLAGEQLPRIC
jgi:hydrogenase expression/formation protein HypE